jgi:lysophospholipase L1-like esterase
MFQLIRSRLPEVPVSYISMKPSPRREKFLDAMKTANEQIKEFLSKEKKTSYIDIFSAMRNADNSLNRGLFLQDSLHMNPQGYKLWQPLIQPHLIKD